MKERIVIEKIKECRPHPALRYGVNCIDTKYCRYEQVPETFEELKELCEKLCEKIKVIEVYTEYISCHKFLFWKNGAISSETDDGEEIVYISDRTPQQMWEIIKNLIGEE